MSTHKKKRGSEKPPPKVEPRPFESVGSSHRRIEPALQLDLPESRPLSKERSGFAPSTPHMPKESIFELDTPRENKSEGSIVSETSSNLGEAIDALKPHVDTIAKTAESAKLTRNEIDVLRRYIQLKETETRDLLEQHRQYEQTLHKLSSDKDNLKQRMKQLIEQVEDLKQRETAARHDNEVLKKRSEEELQILKNDNEERLKKIQNAEQQMDEFASRKELWKEKVKEDLKRIKLRERELENKNELLKRDMQALLDSKDKHVLELKKKVDALELELESMEDRVRRGNVILASMDSKKQRLIQTLKLATSLLEEIDSVPTPNMDEKKNTTP